MNSKQIGENLRRIQASVPKYLREDLFKKEKATPGTSQFAEALLGDKRISNEKKEGIRQHMEQFNKQKEVLNERAAQQIDSYVDTKIKEAIREGKLPPQSQALNQAKKEMYEK